MHEITAQADPNMLKFGTTVLNEQTEPYPLKSVDFYILSHLRQMGGNLPCD